MGRIPGLRPPAQLDAVAAAEWRRICRQRDCESLDPAERADLVAYCIAWSALVQAEQRISKVNAELLDEKGEQLAPADLTGERGRISGRGAARTISLAQQARVRALDEIFRLARKLGLTPASRTRKARV